MAQFSDIKHNAHIYLYAGSMREGRRDKYPFVGLCLSDGPDALRVRVDPDMDFHIQHNITKRMDVLDNTVDIYQAEDVMEHIEYDLLPVVFNDIYRALKPGGLFRLSVPDYRCDVLYARSKKDDQGNLLFDPGGGGRYDPVSRRPVGGHLWFPKFENVSAIFDRTKFAKEKTNFLHYYPEDGTEGVCKDIDYSLGDIGRTPDNDDRVKTPRRPMSLVVDAIK